MEEISTEFKTQADELPKRLEKISEENRSLQKKVSELETKLAAMQTQDLIKEAVDTNYGKLLVKRADGLNMDILKSTCEKFSQKLKNAIIVLASVNEEKVSFVVKVDEALISQGYNAGKIISELAQKLGGKGGGRPNFAQGGAKEVQNLDKALSEIFETLK